jgi:eukaryotic-like serine/threonine-protein kinase
MPTPRAMTDERWQQVHELFQAALERLAADRKSFLDEVCAEDVDMRREIESLLAAEAAEGRFDRLMDRFGVEAGETMPEQVGPYRVLRELGRGGMGVVYLGESTHDELHRPVALKVFHAGAGRADLVERFLAEREILSRLDHPNIARLLSGGVTDDGRPYFAMEYVAGRPITEYCDAHRLGIEGRLRLFLDVGAAVQHAHRHLVVHRDLKPSNILVTEAGEVRLLDFGIAKLLDEGADDEGTPLTLTALVLMTPEYASPEQVRGEPMTTATDVYQLGVLLYELLAGRRPYRVPSRLLREVERVVCGAPLEKPSAAITRVAELGDAGGRAPGEVSRTRGTTVERLRRRLAGDLDTIVLMALRKEPERRYPSVEALVEDVRRHLDGRPVEARPDALGYRAAKFVGRHRLGVSAVAAVAVLLLAFSVALAAQAARLARENERAERVTAFLVELFENADPDASPDGPPTLRDVLDEGVRRIRSDLPEQPLVRAALLDAMGRSYGGLGLGDDATPLLEEALGLREEHLAADHPDIALSYRSLGRVALENAQDPEDREAARARLEDVLGRLRRRYGERHLLVGVAHNDLGFALQLSGAYPAARAHYDSALSTLRALDGAEAREEEAATLSNLGWVAQAEGDLAASESSFEAVLELRRGLYPSDHPRLANSLFSLADIRRRRGDAAGAEPLMRQAVSMHERLYPGPQAARAGALLGLANTLSSIGEYGAADSVYGASLDMLRAMLPADDHRVARVLNDWASLHEDQGDLERADSLYGAAAELYARTLGEGHLFTRIVQGNVADMRRRLGRLEEAEALYRRIIPQQEAAAGTTDLSLAAMRTGLANTLLDQGRPAEAEPLLRQALGVRRGVLPETHDQRLLTLGLLGRALLGLERYAEAEEALLEYHEVVQDDRGPDAPVTRWARERLAELYEAWGRPEQSDRYRDPER